MAIKSLDRIVLGVLRRQLQTAVESVSSAHGLKITVGNARFTADNAVFKLEIATVGKNGVNTREVADFKSHASLFGLEQADLGREIAFCGTTYTIIGLAPRSHRRPVIVQRLDGKRFKVPIAAVTRGKS